MKHYTYKTSGTCSRQINFDSDGEKIYNVEFIMGCNGNTQGISKLVEEMSIDEIVKRLENINCGSRGTSCPAQLAKAVLLAKE